ncbi:hypothetical protein OSTOST_09135 [Ostertagia ostertagi]
MLSYLELICTAHIWAGAPGYGPAPIQTIIVGSVAFNQNPSSMMCPHCHQQILTKTVPKSGLLTWLLCGGMALFGIPNIIARTAVNFWGHTEEYELIKSTAAYVFLVLLIY